MNFDVIGPNCDLLDGQRSLRGQPANLTWTSRPLSGTYVLATFGPGTTGISLSSFNVTGSPIPGGDYLQVDIGIELVTPLATVPEPTSLGLLCPSRLSACSPGAAATHKQLENPRAILP